MTNKLFFSFTGSPCTQDVYHQIFFFFSLLCLSYFSSHLFSFLFFSFYLLFSFLLHLLKISIIIALKHRFGLLSLTSVILNNLTFKCKIKEISTTVDNLILSYPIISNSIISYSIISYSILSYRVVSQFSD